MTEREVLTWETYGRAGRDLAQSVADDGYRPDLILAIARGGLFLAGSIGYALNIKNIHLINVEFYTGVDARLTEPVLLPPVPEPTALSGATILIVDDVADTGGTLQLVQDFCAPQAAATRTAVIYEKPQSTVKCDYVWSHTDRCIDFPWSSQPPVVPTTHR